MTVVKVYGLPLSTCTARVLTCLIEKGVEYELIPVDLSVGAHKQPAFLAKQPFEVESQQYNPPISTIVYELVIKGMYGMTTDQAVVDAQSEKLGKVLDVYEARLSENKYLAGNSYSLADQNHIPYTFFLMKTPLASLINSRPHVKAWWEDISSRPSFQKVLANANA
ncbi:Glutathione s-transferase [Thalictrum thalictroides]|uniref:glutathione transferase n=1 Tax=Thalictrum thalictroides TaxID=46969 RepID=A0A7J6VDE5_THATH|nr:Glutathione s-transferase [Thalictrum thalictroides]